MDSTNRKIKKLEKLVGILFSKVSSLEKTVDEQKSLIIQLRDEIRTSPEKEMVGSLVKSQEVSKKKKRTRRKSKNSEKKIPVEAEIKLNPGNPAKDEKVLKNAARQRSRFYYRLRTRNKRTAKSVEDEFGDETVFENTVFETFSVGFGGGYKPPDLSKMKDMTEYNQYASEAMIQEKPFSFVKQADYTARCLDRSCPASACRFDGGCGYCCKVHHGELCGKVLLGCSRQ